MGISEDVARSALLATNNDLEGAVNFIFSNDLPPPPAYNVSDADISMNNNNDDKDNTQIIPANIDSNNYSVDFTNSNGFQPGDLNDYVMIDNNSQVNNNFSNNYQSNEQFIDISSDEEDDEQQPPTSIEYENVIQIIKDPHKKNVDDITVFLPKSISSLNKLHDYIGLFLYSLSILYPLKIFNQDFKDSYFDPNWFNDNNDYNYVSSLFAHLQKISSVFYSSNNNSRSFVSSKSFDRYLKDFNFSDDHHLYEIFPSLINYLLQIDYDFNNQFDFKNLLVSTALYTNFNNENENRLETTDLKNFHFLPDEYDTNLYKMFNSLIFPDDDIDNDENINLNENSLDNLAPIMTIIFDEVDDDMSQINTINGVEIPIEFYPQLYTKKSKDQYINTIIKERKITQDLLRDLLKQINSLKSFQGKDITNFLQSTIDFTNDSNNDISLNLKSILTEMTNLKNDKMELYKNLTSKLHSDFNISHPELSIIDNAKKLELIDCPYLLTTAVVSPYLYFIRVKQTEWVKVQSNKYGSDCEVIKCESQKDVQETIKKYTKTPSSSPLMFIYTKQDFYLKNSCDDNLISSMINSNSGIQDFLKKDEQILKNTPVITDESIDIELPDADTSIISDSEIISKHFDNVLKSSNI